MILRKPYAFFIKYFRVINLIIAVLMGALLYQTYVLFKLFNTYVSDYTVIGSDFEMGSYINMYSFLLPLIIIIGNIIVLSVLFIKKKPTKLYLLNLVVYLVTIIIFALDYSSLQSAMTAILDVRTSKAMRDLTLFVFLAQIVCLIITSVRAIGFDIKSFDFKADLENLEINEKDNEEVEVEVKYDSNKTRRVVRKNFRYLGYFYRENRFFINLGIVLTIVIIGFIIFINKTIYVSNYNQGTTFSASNYNFNVKNSYILTSDKNGNIIKSGKAFVAVRLSVSSYSKKDLNTGLITLRINDKSYSKCDNCNSGFDDLGQVYIDEEITKEFNDYILVYMIPLEEIDNSMSVRINDNISYVRGEMGAKNIFIKLKPMDLSKKVKESEYSINETIDFTGSLLGNSSLTIKNMSFADRFKEEYEFCSSANKCFNSYEYITPTASGNYEKTLVQIDGNFKVGDNLNLPNLENLYRFLNSYATFSYYVDGKWYSQHADSKFIKPISASSNYTYLEVNKKMLKASKVYMTINVRNYSYRYNIK